MSTLSIKLPDGYSVTNAVNEIYLFYGEDKIQTFLKDHVCPDPIMVEPVERRILSFVEQHQNHVWDKDLFQKSINQMMMGVDLADPNITTASGNNPALTYEDLQKMQNQMQFPARQQGKSQLRGMLDPPKRVTIDGREYFIPKDYSLVLDATDPLGALRDIKIYYFDRLIGIAKEERGTREEIDRIIKEHRNVT